MHTRTPPLLALLCVVGVALTPTTAVAGTPAPDTAFYVGASAGVHLRLDAWDLQEEMTLIDDASVVSPALALRIGLQPLWFLAAELSVGTVIYWSELDDTNVAMTYGIDVLFFLTKTTWQPFIDVGLGGYHNVAGDHGADADFEGHWGLGLRGHLSEQIAFRLDARHILTDTHDVDSAVANNLVFMVGIDGIIGRANHDAEDEPETPADSDGDGIIDGDDKCPQTPGVAAHDGCPAPVTVDRDGDGVADGDDKCPDVAGKTTLAGCPDGDGDGVADGDDKCPKTAGPVASKGCPPTPVVDRDGDGVADADDKCPAIAGGKATQGCPDRDGDGVADSVDKCPSKAGTAALNGCPPPTVKQTPTKAYNGRFSGVRFRLNEAAITPRAAARLDEVAATLKANPSVNILVIGHTDNVGDADANQALSQRRAIAVRTYLVRAGVALGRIQTLGKGSSDPKHSNDTVYGRVANRRAEIQVR